jgi:predicted CXXCH cytochrome family protein
MAEDEQKIGKPRRGYAWLGLGALIFGVMSYFYYLYPEGRIGPRQPVSFSHRVHAGVKQINCRFCHSNVERSANAGLPAVETCFFCHTYIIPGHPEILKEKQYHDAGTPVPWVRIFWVPDFVFFNHVPHVRWAKFDCTQCHGDVKSMDRLQKKKFKMNFCINCHREKRAQLDCWLACHR